MKAVLVLLMAMCVLLFEAAAIMDYYEEVKTYDRRGR